MKTKFTTDCMGRVTITYDAEGWDGEVSRVERTFTCPEDGGYVRERMSSGWEQVCDQLAHRGNTLSCSGRDKLLVLIRGEYQAMRRAEKRARAA